MKSFFTMVINHVVKTYCSVIFFQPHTRHDKCFSTLCVIFFLCSSYLCASLSSFFHIGGKNIRPTNSQSDKKISYESHLSCLQIYFVHYMHIASYLACSISIPKREAHVYVPVIMCIFSPQFLIDFPSTMVHARISLSVALHSLAFLLISKLHV